MQLSLKQKFIFITLLTASLIYVISFSYILSSLQQSSKHDAEKIIKSEARLYASNIAAKLNLDMGVAKGMAVSMYDYEDLSPKQKKIKYDQLIENTLIMNKSYKGTWYSWQLSAFDPNWGNESGRVLGAFIREQDNDNFLQIFDSIDIGGIERYNNYHRIMNGKIEGIFEPYKDRTIGILETTVAVPIVKNNEFAGLVGIDLDLSSFQDMISKIKPYETGYAFLMSNTGKYVYHPESALLDSTFAEVNPIENKEYGVSDSIKKGTEHQFYAEYSISQGDIFVFFTPVQVGNTDTPWSLGVIVYMDQVMAESNEVIRNTLLTGIIGLFLLLGILLSVTNYAFRFINKGIEFAKKISQGDLTAQLDVNSSDEIGQLASALRIMVDRFKEMIHDMKLSAVQMADFASILKNESLNYTVFAEKQDQAASTITNSLNDISTNIKLSHSNTSSTEMIAKKATEELKKGNRLINQTVGSMDKIANHITIIGDIADRTDILAINASIEAANAGEYGKGFAVVANEIRKLSERSALAASQIDELTQDGVNISNNTGEMLSKILPELEKTSNLVQEIVELSTGQTESIDKIIREMDDLNSISSENKNTADEMAANATKLERLSVNLNKIVDKFKI